MPLCFIEPQDAIRVIAESVGREARRQLVGEVVRAWVDEIPEQRARAHYAKAIADLDEHDLSMLAAWHASLEVGQPIANRDFLVSVFPTLGENRREALKIAAGFRGEEAFDAGVAEEQALDTVLPYLSRARAEELADRVPRAVPLGPARLRQLAVGRGAGRRALRRPWERARARRGARRRRPRGLRPDRLRRRRRQRPDAGGGARRAHGAAAPGPVVDGNGDREVREGAVPWVAQRLGDRASARSSTTFVPTVEADGVLYCHATPRSDTELVTAITPDADVPAAIGRAGTVVCGHVHAQYDRAIGPLRLVNAGSVGMPYEGRPGAFWLELADGVPAAPALGLRRRRRRRGDPRHRLPGRRRARDRIAARRRRARRRSPRTSRAGAS